MRDKEDQSTFWPQWLADDFPAIGVWSLSYAADISAWQRESMALPDRAGNVLDGLVSAGLGERPLIFISHSLGGLLVKQLLHTSCNLGVPRWREIAGATRGIAFIATPHSGSDLASVLSFFGTLLRANEPVEDLSAHDPHLRDLHGWFLNTFLPERSVVCRTYSERREVRPGFLGVKLPKGRLVVDATSSEPNILGERAISLDEDHFSICKPSDRGAALCKSIWAFVRECLRPKAPTPDALHELTIDSTFRTAHLGFLPGSGSPASLLRLAKPKPRFEELFEILTDPDEVPKALFGTEGGKGWVPYEVKLVQGRVGMADVRQSLSDALIDSGGRLLLAGRGGIGKTRETAELAADLCLRGWVVGVARTAADVRLGPIAPISGDLHDARLLLIVDNLHARASADDEPPSYPERLTQCIESLSRQGLDDLRVIAITRDEPRFEKSIGLEPSGERWREFTVFRLPDLTTEGLSTILAGLVARAALTVDASALAKLVANSDRTPRTLFINVDLSVRRRQPLDDRHWLPTEGETWREKNRAVLAKHPASAGVQASLRLLTDLGLPPRLEYVIGLGTASEAPSRRTAIEALIDEGLVGRRRDELRLFDPGPVTEGTARGPRQSDETWQSIIHAFTRSSAETAKWFDDLAVLALALLRAERPELVLSVTALAIGSGAESALLYKAQSGAHFLTNEREAALRDLDEAIARDAQDGSSWFLRGLVNYMQGNGDRVLTDMAKARELGHEAGIMHSQCGLIYQQRGQWREAVAEFDRAIELEGADTDGMLFFLRGTAREQLGDLAAAAGDLDTAMVTPSNALASMKLLPALQAQGSTQLLEAFRNEPPKGLDHAAVVYPARGSVRLRLGRFAEAEQDFDAAIRLDFAGTIETVAAALEATPIPVVAQVLAASRSMRAQLAGDAMLYACRGIARREQQHWDDALADFEIALQRGAKPEPILIERAVLHLRRENYAEAQADCTAALADADSAAVAHSIRGLALQGLKRPAEAEGDFDTSIKLGRDDALVYLWRAPLRAARGDLIAAAADVDCAIARPSTPPAAWLIRAGLRLDLQQAALAEEDADEAIRRGADAAAAYALRGGARLNLGRHEEAVADLSESIARGRDDALVYRFRGIARAQQGHQEALADLDAALKRGDTEAVTLFWRGCARLDAGEPDLAEADLDLALERGFDPASVKALRGIVRERLGRHADALADLDDAIEQGKVNLIVLTSRAAARIALANLEGAAEDLQRARSLAPRAPDLVSNLADLLRTQKRYAAAARVLDDALEGSPDEHRLRWKRGEVNLFAGRFEAAEIDYDTIIALRPDEPSFKGQRSIARYGRGDMQGAIDDLTLVIAKHPANPQPLADRAEAYVLMGRLDEAARDLSAMAALSPDAATAHRASAMLALAQGDLESAQSGFEQTVAADPSSNVWCRLGLARLLGARSEDALAAYKEALRDLLPGDARVALLELDHWIALKSADAHAVGQIRSQLDAVVRSGLD
jgi:tetratricopeptide (TPR) repeat protein